MSQAGPTTLTSFFRSYYGEILAQARRIEQSSGDLPHDEIQGALLERLSTLDEDAADRFASDPLTLEQARYLLAGFADDYFTRLEWSGAEPWKADSLEARLFQTDDAGIEIFRRADKLVKVGDPGAQDLARVYFWILALGFRGSLSEGSAGRTRRRLRRGLLNVSAPDRSGDGGSNRWITPSAYRHTLAGGTRASLPALRRWRWLVAGLAGLVVAVTLLAYTVATSDVAVALAESRALPSPETTSFQEGETANREGSAKSGEGDLSRRAGEPVWRVTRTTVTDVLDATAVISLLLLIVLVWALIRLARNRRTEVDRETIEPELTHDALDWTLPPPRPGLRRSFSRARDAILGAFSGRREARKRPWILVLGPADAGKTTLLGRSGIAQPFGQPFQPAAPHHPGVNWWNLGEGIALDIVGDDVLRADGASSDGASWREILRRIRRERPRRPIDGVVLTLPAAYFLDPAKPEAQRLAEASRRGTLLRRKLSEAQRVLGMRAPVHLVVSHCDTIPGFQTLVETTDGDARQQLFGWSNPLSPDARYSGAWVDRALRTVRDELESFQMAASQSGARAASSEEFVRLPNRLGELLAPLRVCATHLFAADGGSEPASLRGIFFCGGSPTAALHGEPALDVMAPEIGLIGDLFDHKVYPEAALAQPTDRARRRARLRRALWASAAVLLAAWGVLGVVWGAPRIARAAPGVARLVTAIAGRSSPAPAPSTFLAEASKVEEPRLRSIALPGGYLSGLKPEVDDVVEYGFESFALQPAHASLVGRAETLIASSTAAPPPAGPTLASLYRRASAGQRHRQVAVYPIEKYPEFGDLERFSQKLAELDGAIAEYDRVAGARSRKVALESFGRLTNSVFGAKLSPRSARASRYYGRRLAALDASPFDHGLIVTPPKSTGATTATGRGLDQRMKKTVLELADRLFDALFDQNPLLQDLDYVVEDWLGGGTEWSRGDTEPEAYRQLFEDLQRLQRHLALPDLQWTAADRLDLGARFDDIRRRVHESPFLGPEVSEQMTLSAIAGFERLQAQLPDFETGDTGALVELKGDEWVLTADAQAVLDGLQTVLREPFMRGACTPAPLDPSPDGRVLYWLSTPLEKAVALYADYKKWEDTGELPAPLANTAEDVVQEATAKRVSCLLADAQSFESPVLSQDLELIETNILQQVLNLQANEASLQALFDALSDLDLRAQQRRLGALLRQQRLYVLAQLQSLLEKHALYEPLGGGFAAWQGEPAPAVVGFGVADAAGVKAYLGTQLEVVTRLSTGSAQPTLALFATAEDMTPLGSSGPSGYWQKVVRDLAAYDGKVPGNTVAALEDVVTTLAGDKDPDLFDLYACFDGRLPTAANARADDYFGTRNDEIRVALQRRCGQLADSKGHALYVELGKFFNDRLYGLFPFASVDARGAAEPDDIRTFFQKQFVAEPFATDFAHAFILIENLPAKSEAFHASRDSVVTFMNRMETVRAFFSSFLAAEAKDGLPIYDVGVKFRIDRTREEGANQIISWLMSVGEEAKKGDKSRGGEKVIDLLDTGSVTEGPDIDEPPTPDGRWVFGKPVTLAFRWATGSPYSPHAPTPGLGPSRWSVDDRTLLYRFREPWSLLRLLVAEQAPRSEFPDLEDPNPVTLKLSIATVSDDCPGSCTVADLYIQVSLLAPDTNAVLPMPEFHTLQAPLTQDPPADADATAGSQEPTSEETAAESGPADVDEDEMGSKSEGDDPDPSPPTEDGANDG